MKPNNKKVISNLCFVNVIGKGTICSNYVCTVDVMVAQYDTLFAIIKIVLYKIWSQKFDFFKFML